MLAIPAGATVKVEIEKSLSAKVGGERVAMPEAVFEIEIYAAPNIYQPFTVTAEL